MRWWTLPQSKWKLMITWRFALKETISQMQITPSKQPVHSLPVPQVSQFTHNRWTKMLTQSQIQSQAHLRFRSHYQKNLRVSQFSLYRRLSSKFNSWKISGLRTQRVSWSTACSQRWTSTTFSRCCRQLLSLQRFVVRRSSIHTRIRRMTFIALRISKKVLIAQGRLLKA